MKSSDRIYSAVEAQISQRELLPGDPVDEENLMIQFGVSRTPVREAIVRLKAQGLVSSISRGGSIVAKMNIPELLAVWELLADLEGLCAAYACDRMTKAERKALAEVHGDASAVAERDDDIGWQKANLAFHEVLYAGSRNPYLRQEILRMRIRTSAYRSHSFSSMGHVRNAHEYHGKIVKAILASNKAEATRLAREHLSPEGAPGLMELVRKLPKDLLG